jgi:hypothetical protein
MGHVMPRCTVLLAALLTLVVVLPSVGDESPNEQKVRPPAPIEKASGSSECSEKEIFPSYDPHHPPPADFSHPFELSQEYPRFYNHEEKFPWESIDYRIHPEAYLRSVLNEITSVIATQLRRRHSSPGPSRSLSKALATWFTC